MNEVTKIHLTTDQAHDMDIDIFVANSVLSSLQYFKKYSTNEIKTSNVMMIKIPCAF